MTERDIDAQVAEDFFAQHAAGGPSNVVLVHFEDRSAIFSSIAKAQEWLGSMPDERDPAVIVPMIIDYPEYGNVVRQ